MPSLTSKMVEARLFCFKGESMKEENLIPEQQTEIICPWCFAVIEINDAETPLTCNTCRRIITNEDLESQDE